MLLPKRKNIRLKTYDYSQNGAYFITICTKDKRNILWTTTVGTTCGRPNESQNLSNIGKIIDDEINKIESYLRIIQQFKGTITKRVKQPIWQKSFYDRIIRNKNEYLQIYTYIDTNPLKWEEDCYYVK